jgi:predicted enzyme related to lactoylglutathione lyase
MISARLSPRPRTHGHFVWYELMTTDMEAAKGFYAQVIGWGTHDAALPDVSYTVFTAAGVSVSGVLRVPEEAVKSGFRPTWLGYVGVDDVDTAAARVAQLGGALHVPPKEIPNVSRFSIAVDPQMATIAVFKWIEDGHEQPPDLDAPGHVGWHELFAADWQSVWHFYEALFGWQKAQTDSGQMGTYQLFSVGDVTIGGMFTKPAAVPVPFWLYYFNVGDIDDAAKRVKAAHGQILDGPVEVAGDRWILRCTDPQGAIFALVGKRSHHGIGYFERLPPRMS